MVSLYTGFRVYWLCVSVSKFSDLDSLINQKVVPPESSYNFPVEKAADIIGDFRRQSSLLSSVYPNARLSVVTVEEFDADEVRLRCLDLLCS